MAFKIISDIRDIEVIAAGRGILHFKRLNKVYGKAHWRKLKGFCRIKLEDGAVLEAEVHWYEGHGIGKREVKIKRLL
jgi:hypothetical protein